MTTKEKNKLDKLWGALVHERKPICECCGKGNCRLEAHHIFTRDRKSTRWDLENGLLLCSYCHKFSPVLSAHKAPRAFYEWLERKNGKDWLDNLEKKSNKIFKGSFDDVIKTLTK